MTQTNGDIWITCHRFLIPHYLSLPGTNIDLFIEMATTKVEEERDNLSELLGGLKEIIYYLEEMKRNFQRFSGKNILHDLEEMKLSFVRLERAAFEFYRETKGKEKEKEKDVVEETDE
jgi:hypothetical protein